QQQHQQQHIDSPITKFFYNSTILITGGNGFLGKILIYKLLKTFTLKRIFILIRTKDNLNIKERLEKLFNEPIFDDIRKNQEELLELVHPIRIDYNSDEMFSNSDRKLLIENVEIVFNLVASVRFNEKLSDAIGINLLGTKKIINLVEAMTHLKSFVHISTLYCNCNRKFIGEKIYKPNFDYKALIKLNETLNRDELEKIKHCIIGTLPNSYTLTKNLAECLVKHTIFGKIPVGIFRPPVVMSIYKDPIPGWTDNIYGPSGICLWIACGIIRCAIGDPNNRTNMVPVDYVINALITSAWDISTRYQMRKCESSEIPVYNYVFKSNNITWNQYISLARKGFHEPFGKQMWCFSFILFRWKWLYKIGDFFLHMIPGYIFDLIALARGKQRIFKKSHEKREKILHTMGWFSLQNWDYSNKNIIEMYNRMTPKDRKLFELHWDTINWSEYFKNYLSGIRKYYLKEKNEKLEKRKAMMKMISLSISPPQSLNNLC
ncbi:fatty acyl-CoA reductase wat, partial [Condylostylus longicornis]|uniref:fatty acyl-CoA reductase wat n=1 Tax=Condylostylus longicornis TaxID=2530218 RepID=UPI00244DE09D